MKRALYATFTLLLLSSSSYAQWPQHIYGSSAAPINEELTDGRITNLQNKPGYMLAGVNRSGTNLNLFSLTRTNPSGIVGVTSPYFKNNYRLSDATSLAAALRVGELVVEENGDHFVTAGSFSRGNIYNYGIFFQHIDFNGTLIPLTMPNINIGYRPLEPNLFQAASVKKIIRSQRYPGNFYILGSLTYANSTRQTAFVLRITATGSLVWSSSYSVNITGTASTVPFDLVESVQPNAGIYELLMVGEYYPQTTGNADAFVIRINSQNGVINNPNVQLYGTAASHDGFTSIKTSQNPYFDANRAGYIIGGHSNSNINTGKDFWFIGIKQGGSIVTNSLFNYTMLNSDHCADIMEHNNGNWQYYLAGYTNNGVFNNEDMMVVGTDQTGTPFAPGQYTFGSNNNQRCVRMHKDNGLALFGNSTSNLLHPTTSQDMYLVRSSFTGFSDCSSFRQFLPRVAGPQALPVVPCTGGLPFSTIPTYTQQPNTLDQHIVCCTAKPNALMHWNFSSGSLVDNIHGFTANAFGGVAPTSGFLSVPNTAMEFDGVSGYLRVPFDPIMELNSWTITALVRPDDFYPGICQGNSIVWRGDDKGPNCYGLMFHDNNFDGNNCNASNPSNYIFQPYPAGNYPGGITDPIGPIPCVSNPCINPGQWYCVWGSYDASTGKMDTYVDGILRVSLDWPDQYTAPSMEDLFIGASSYASWGGLFPYYFKGAIDDIAIYDGPITCPLDCDKAANGQVRKAPIQLVPGADISISPNPATEFAVVGTGANWAGATIQVLSATAQVVMETVVDVSGKTRLDVSELPAGLYLVRIQNEGQYTVQKLIKR